MEMKVLDHAELAAWVRGLPPSMAIATLLVGDRLSCCDEAVALEVEGEIVGVATIAPEGEQLSGQPTIVALYVKHQFRQRGYGRQLMKAAIARCQERGFEKVRVDIMSTPAKRIIESLTEEERSYLEMIDLSNSLLDLTLMA